MPYNSKIYQMAKTVLENKREKDQDKIRIIKEYITKQIEESI